jgi:CubicO group peptidase (beta-lactamase class C family)
MLLTLNSDTMRSIFILIFGLSILFTNAQKDIQQRIDSIVENGIRNGAFPGAQVFLKKGDKILVDKAYGYHTYDSITEVSLSDLYDLASITKVVGSTLALMKLYDDGLIELDKPFSHYFPDWKNHPKKSQLTVRELLAHQGGIVPYIVYLNKVKKRNGKLKKRWVTNTQSDQYPTKAYEGIYIHKRFKSYVYRKARRSKHSDKTYRYSGLTFLMIPEVVERLSGKEFETFLKENFYQNLEANELLFNPANQLPIERIVPTEQDSLFRKSLTRGWVHDENAALLGGVSGNAGLFSNTHSLRPVLELFLNKGKYQGREYLKASTVETFTRIQFKENNNRRGLGFDKPMIENDTLSYEDSYPAPLADLSGYGHSGFTGTFFWVDPATELIYIFLSNRVYPSREQQAIYDLNIRKAILYEGLKVE